MLKEKVLQFIRQNNCNMIGYVDGMLGSICAKVQNEHGIYYIFFAREWYRKYDGISIPKSVLDEALNDNAMIVMFVNDEEFWKHSGLWKKGKRIHNTMFDKEEVLMTKSSLEKPQIKFPKRIESFF